jgi:uncharacterized repeat protein (TIGR02543 family)
MKTVYKIGMLAVAALAFAGCSKEINNSTEQTIGTHTITFTVQKDIDTKTAVQEGDGVASYVWTEGDEAYMVIFENDKKATNVVMSDLSEDHKIATFTATFNDSEATSFTYKAVYGSSVSNSKNPLIPSSQSPKLTSFDPAADALVSVEDIVLEDGAKADENTEFKFKLRRVVSANKMTLKGLEANEKIVKVELESEDSYFSARYMWDNDDYSHNDGNKKLIFDYSGIDAKVASDGTFPVYFTSAPVDGAAFTVKVMTDKHLYFRDNFTSTLTLAVGTFRRFGINLADYGTPIQQATEYKLVEDNAQLVDGAEFLIVAKGKSMAAGAYNASNKYFGAESVSVSNKVISITAEPVQVFTLEAGSGEGNFYVKDASGKYVAGGNKTVTLGDTKFEWTVSSSGMSFVLSGTTYNMQYNNSNPRFTAYSSSQTAIELYINESSLVQKLATPVIELEAGEDNIHVTWNAVSGAASYKVTCTDQEDITTTETEVTISGLEAGFYTVTVTAVSGSDSYRDSNPATADVKIGTPELDKAVITSVTPKPNGFDAIFTGVENAEVYRWVVFDAEGTGVGGGETSALSFSSTYNEEDYWEEMVDGATYRLVIYADAEGFATSESDAFRFVWKGPSYDFTTVAELNTFAADNAGEKTGTLTDAVVSFAPTANDAIIKDASGSILYHKNGHGLKQGQTFTGETTVTTTLYNGVCEITAIDAEFVGDGTVVEPETVALATIAGDYNTWQGAYVKVENLEVDSVNGKYVYVKNGDGTYQVYSSAGNATCVEGDIITVIGTVTKYSGNPQLKVWFTKDIVITQHQVSSHKITFSQPEAGGSFTVKVGNTVVNSGDELDEGTVVTLNATAVEGYVFNGWTVTGATVSGNTETANFTVGTSDVSISASFISNSATIVEFLPSTFGTVTSSSYDAEVGPISIVVTNGTVTNDQIRIFKNQTITISSTSKTITKIEFVCTEEGAAQYGPGCFEATAGYSYEGNVGTWVGSSSSVSLKASSNQVRATVIKVTYQ